MPSSPVGTISEKRALEIARRDAKKIYRDLSLYRVKAKLAKDGWHVDYELANPTMQGGGPHYVIDNLSGEIRSKRYEQ